MKIEYSLIKNEEQYQKYLERFEEIFDCEEGTHEEIELELLGLLIDKYESEKIPIPDSDPIDTIKFIMEQNELKPGDLAKILNSPSRATEILRKQRPMSLNHIRLIHHNMNIPAETLIKDYELEI
jgi:HTH-type transcriptional regulator/antitoxin HigA